MKALRTGLVAVLLLWMTVGAVVRQGFGVESPALPAWHMYRTFGTGLLDIRMTRVDGGRTERVDRLAALGYPDWREAPRGVRWVRDPAVLDGQIAEVCETLGPGVDLRVEARLSRVAGWRVLRDGRANACP